MFRCLTLFAESGYSGLSMRKIASELGVSTGTLYHYFSSKTDIYEQMLKSLSQSDVLEAVAKIPEEANFDQRIDILFELLEDKESYFTKLLQILCDHKNNSGELKNHPVVIQTLEFYKASIIAHVIPGNMQLGNLIFSIVIGILMQKIFEPQMASFEEHKLTSKQLASLIFADDSREK